MHILQKGALSRQHLLENITLLWSLNEIPANPSHNVLPNMVDDTRQLSIEREKVIVESLAFLAAHKKDPRRVMAVCVEEMPDKKGLLIRISSNTGELEYIEREFGQMGVLLEKTALKGTTCFLLKLL